MADQFYTDFSITLPVISNRGSIPAIAHKIPSFLYDNADETLVDLKTTVERAYRKLCVTYDVSKILLSEAEIFSLVIGLRYKSNTRDYAEILPTPTYFLRVEKIVHKYFRSENKRFFLHM